jgi:hypothetical protein
MEQQTFQFDDKTESRFEAYVSENPQVYRMFCLFTKQLIRAGWNHLGAKMIAERVRFESYVKGNDGYKINNSFVSYFARRFERDHPQHQGIFEFRKSKADAEI